jgi:hypothetical protein
MCFALLSEFTLLSSDPIETGVDRVFRRRLYHERLSDTDKSNKKKYFIHIGRGTRQRFNG